MPEFKIFFLDAIASMNGGKKEVTPDLYQTLIGEERKILIEAQETETKLKSKIDELLETSKDPEIQALIKEQGIVHVRETVFTSIMRYLDNVEITTNDGRKGTFGQLQAA